MSITPAELARARQLFEDLLPMPAESREAHLAAAAGGDPELQAYVRSLLVAHSSPGDLLDQSPGELLSLVGVGNPVPSLVGRTVGAYRVSREIGRGGMGAVYEAFRADEQFTKRVAIKTLGAGASREHLGRRFQREREIHARLAHPNIAGLLDAGVTEDGVPYLVLEFIDGLRIDAFCEARKLSLPARLDLFRQVLDAVQHAHRQLVVHRDLKPGNILVNEDGVVKLLDFGISKLLEDDSLDMTQTGSPGAFTLAYASPEQMRGEPVSTATDIYSLGTVLYQLVTGRHPLRLERDVPSPGWSAIATIAPEVPSATATAEAARAMGLVSPARLRRALQGELDAIVMMALRKEADRRYPTADAMSEDLRRFLQGRPVMARPDSLGYRVRKLVGRNRAATVASALAVVALVTGAGIATRQARAAEQERRTAERVAGFLEEVFAMADPSWAGRGLGRDATLAQAIDAVAKRVTEELGDEPAAAERIHKVLVSSYAALGRTEDGLRHARERLRLLDQLEAAPLVRARGLHDLGMQWYLAGQQDSARVALDASYALFEAEGFPDSDDLVFTLNMLGLLVWHGEGPAQGEPLIARALEVRRRLAPDDAIAAIASSNLGIIRDARGDLDGAERYFRDAIAIYQGLTDREYFESATNLNNLAAVLILRGEYPEAETAVREGIAIWERTLGPTHWMIGVGRLNLGRIELERGRPDSALALQRAGEALLRPLGAQHPQMARNYILEALVLLALRRAGAAEAPARQAVEIRRGQHPADDWRVAEAEGVLGRVLVARGQPENGRPLLSRSLEVTRRTFGEEHPRTRTILRAWQEAGGDVVTPAGS